MCTYDNPTAEWVHCVNYTKPKVCLDGRSNLKQQNILNLASIKHKWCITWIHRSTASSDDRESKPQKCSTQCTIKIGRVWWRPLSDSFSVLDSRCYLLCPSGRLRLGKKGLDSIVNSNLQTSLYWVFIALQSEFCIHTEKTGRSNKQELGGHKWQYKIILLQLRVCTSMKYFIVYIKENAGRRIRMHEFRKNVVDKKWR